MRKAGLNETVSQSREARRRPLPRLGLIWHRRCCLGAKKLLTVQSSAPLATSTANHHLEATSFSPSATTLVHVAFPAAGRYSILQQRTMPSSSRFCPSASIHLFTQTSVSSSMLPSRSPRGSSLHFFPLSSSPPIAAVMIISHAASRLPCHRSFPIYHTIPSFTSPSD